MEREAVLLYLLNLRDLEIAKDHIIRTRAEFRNRALQEINQYPTKYKKLQVPVKSDKNVSAGIGEWITGGLTILLWFSLVTSGANLEGIFSEGIVGILLGVLLFSLPVFWMILYDKRIKFSEKRNEDSFQQDMATYEKHVQLQKQKAIINQDKVNSIISDYQNTDAFYEQELEKVEEALFAFYNMNLLASQYRNLPSILYIYDYMSTSQASLENTLIHEHMENGIQRLEERLDQIILDLDDLVFQTRCIRAENEASVQRMISQNNQMLDRLSSIESSSADAAQYAELASNYSKANAYFSLATYLKQ